MRRDIKLQWNYPYSVEVIWDCLTNPEVLKQWNGHNQTTDFKAEVGFKWIEKQKPRKGWDGKMYFEVLEVISFEKLVYSFKGGPDPEHMTLDTVVTWKLIPKSNGTELQLSHTGFSGMKGIFTSFIMEKGWNKHFAKPLMAYLDTKKNEHINL